MKLKQIFINFKDMMSLIWKNNKKYLFFSFLQVFSNSTTPFINIVAVKFLVDSIINKEGFHQLIIIVMWMVILNLIFGNLKTISNNFVKLHAKELMMPMSASFSSKAVEMDYEYTENMAVLEQMGKAAYVLLNAENLELYLGAINNGVVFLIQLVITAFIISTLNPLIIILILVVSVTSMMINLRTQKKNYDLQSEIMPLERRWKYLTELTENLIYGKEVRIYNLQDYIIGKGRENRDRYRVKFNKKARNTQISNLISIILTAAQEVVILIWLAASVIGGATTIGSFTLLLNASRQFAQSFGMLSGEVVNLYKNDNFINEYFKFLKYESRLRSTRKKDTNIDRTKPGVLEFCNVSFKYPNSEQYVLKNVSMTLNPGEKVSIVGENGAGKTTFVKLLMRLYDVTEGEILYNGRNIKDYDYDDYMDVFSTVFQDYKIFALSVYENITFQENLKEKEPVNDIFKEYGVWDKIASLPNQGETILSREFAEDGMELSGGQQQRLALCRAAYKNAPVVILDEPTANLSPVAEHNIYQHFNGMVKNKTALYISHRLSSSKFCDKICVFHEGGIIEYGSHNELMEKNGLYAEMFKLQAQYYVEEGLSNG